MVPGPMRTSLALLAGALVLTLGAAAVRADVTETFVAVDQVTVKTEENNDHNKPHVVVGGVLQGQATATVRTFASSTGFGSHEMLQRCEKLALLALARPGRYSLALTRLDTPNSGGTYYLKSCRLTRVN
jgi:hypothetical protein